MAAILGAAVCAAAAIRQEEQVAQLDGPIAQRISAAAASIQIHHADCRELGFSVHSAAEAAALVGGSERQSKLAVHQQAAVAKHVRLGTDTPLAELRATRAGRTKKQPVKKNSLVKVCSNHCKLTAQVTITINHAQ